MIDTSAKIKNEEQTIPQLKMLLSGGKSPVSEIVGRKRGTCFNSVEVIYVIVTVETARKKEKTGTKCGWGKDQWVSQAGIEAFLPFRERDSTERKTSKFVGKRGRRKIYLEYLY